MKSKSALILLSLLSVAGLILIHFYMIYGFALLLISTVGFIVTLFLQGRKKDTSNIVAELIKDGNLQDQETIKQVTNNSPGLTFILDKFTTTIKDFQESIEEIQKLTDVVIETASESTEQSNTMTDVNLTVSKGAQQQAEDAERSSKSTSELATQFDNVLNAIDTMQDGINMLKELNAQGNDNLAKTIESGNSTKEEMAQVIGMIEELKSSVHEINSITSVITDIAAQTNLLSLNASIEAARAGEAGKGFAVVSTEIRKLSDQSFSSASEIERIITGITKEINSVVESIQTTNQKFEVQQQTINDVYTAFDKINNNVEGLITNQNNIRDHMNVLNEAKDNIIDSISNIAAVAQQSAASTEEAASLSMQQKQSNEILYDLSNTLQGVVDRVGNSIKVYRVNREEKKTKHIAFVSNLHDGHPFTKGMIENGVKAAKKYGYDFAVKHMIKFQEDEQVKMIEELKAEGFDFLIIIPSNQKRLVPVINKLHEEHVPTICVDTDIVNSKRASFIGTDDFDAGKNMGNLIAKQLNGEGRVILSVINADQDNLNARFKGIYDALAKYPKIKVVGEQKGYYDHKERLKDFENTVKKSGGFDLAAGVDGDFGAVIAMYTKEHDTSNQAFIGFDDNPDNIAYIKNGILDAVVAQRQKLFAEFAIKQIYDLDAGKEINQRELLSTYVINKSNVNALSK